MDNLGMKVLVVFSDTARKKGLNESATYRNVTRIHYNCRGVLRGEKRIAFQSDIHRTGRWWNVSDIQEFDTRLETERATGI